MNFESVEKMGFVYPKELTLPIEVNSISNTPSATAVPITSIVSAYIAYPIAIAIRKPAIITNIIFCLVISSPTIIITHK